MKYLILIVMLAFFLEMSGGRKLVAATQAAQTPSQSAATSPTSPGDQENARKARALLDQAIQALGGPAFLNIHDMQEEGRTYSFHHGQPTSNGVLFWRFVAYPNKERIEITKQRDVAYIYTVDKGYEVTYKGPHPIETKDLEDYLRRRRFSLDTLLREWTKDPGLALFYDGNALAGNLPAQQITMINAKNEAVSLFFDIETHLPIKKSYTWRDPVDKERNVEEEIYDNYSARYNEGLNESMFDPNSHYDPNKPAGKH